MISHNGQQSFGFEQSPEMIKYSRDMFDEGTIGHIALPIELEGRLRPNVLGKSIGESSWKLVADKLGLDPRNTSYFDLYTTGMPDEGLFTEPMQERFERVVQNSGFLLLQRIQHTPHSRLLTGALHGDLRYLNMIEPSEEAGMIETIEAVLPEILADKDLRIVDSAYGLSNWKQRDADFIGYEVGETSKEVLKILERTRNLIASKVYRGAFHRYVPTPKRSFGSDLGYKTVAEIPEFAGYSVYDHLDEVERREERHSRYEAILPFQQGSPSLAATLLHDRSDSLDPEIRQRILSVLRRSIRSNPIEVGFGSLVARAVEEDNNIEADAAFSLHNKNYRYYDSLDQLDDLLREISQI